MADTLTTFLKETEPKDREQSIESYLKTRLQNLDRAIGGYNDPGISLSGLSGNVDLTPTQAKYRVVVLKDNPSAAVMLRIPHLTGALADIVFVNNCGGSFSTVTIKSTGANAGNAAGVPILAGYTRHVRHNGESAYPITPNSSPSGYVSLSALAWINASPLLNSWANSGGIYRPASYSIGAEGLVRVRGLVAAGTLNNVAAIFTLPTGYRPDKEEFFVCESAGAYGRARVDTAGNVIPISGSNGAFWLTGICFQAA
jgi:hypothetical protein